MSVEQFISDVQAEAKNLQDDTQVAKVLDFIEQIFGRQIEERATTSAKKASNSKTKNDEAAVNSFLDEVRDEETDEE